MGKNITLASAEDVATLPLVHPGHVTKAGQVKVTVGGVAVAVADPGTGAEFTCGFHGVQKIVAVTTKSTIGGKFIVTSGATCACGAVISSPYRGVTVE